MKKIVDFGISKYSDVGKLRSAHDEMDLVNGTGEYLGIVRLGNKNLMFTRTTRSGAGLHDGEIMINEVDFDVYTDGGIAVYYNLYKSEGVKDLQRAFNSQIVTKLLDEGKSLTEILDRLHVNYNVSFVKDAIETDFHNSEEYIYPKDYDFERAIMDGDSYEGRRDVKKEKVERLIATGIGRELFEDLIRVKQHTHQSIYQLGYHYLDMQNSNAFRR